MTFGSDCTVWDEKADRFCGAPATVVRRDGQSGGVVDVVCDRHRVSSDQAFPFGGGRAPQSTYERKHRFTR